MIKIDLTGKRFGKLTVISRGDKTPHGTYRWICKCDCGNTISVPTNDLQSQHTRSCGCLRRNSKLNTDSRSKHPLYGTWKQMLSRCENPNAHNFSRYGEKGVSVCEEWHDFWSFVAWSDSVGGRPNGFTLDRIDSSGNYEPSNCRWANIHTQAENKTSSIFLTHDERTETLATWAKLLGLSEQCMYNRYHRGWNEADMFLPKQTGNNGHKGRH